MTNADIVLGANGKYYVSTGGNYNIYTYVKKTGTFKKTGTLKASKIDSIVKANNVTNNFMIKYKVNGKESAENNSYKVSVKIYYKPAIKLTANKGSISLLSSYTSVIQTTFHFSFGCYQLYNHYITNYCFIRRTVRNFS